MKNFFNEKKGQFSLYFVGIGGISMSSLALYLKKSGFEVSGYDKTPSKITQKLQEEGISINDSKDLETCDLAVVSSAISKEDDQIKKLTKLNKTLITRARLLYEIASAFPFTIGIAGTHGKTTCVAMTAHVLKKCQKKFTAHIGGLDSEFGNMAFLGDEIFLSEVCEYKKNISLFSPSVGVLLNVSDDHLESYGSFEKLKEEFSEYLLRSKIRIVRYEEGFFNLENTVTFSYDNPKADYFLTGVTEGENFVQCVVNTPIGALFELKINSFFPHDALNALAVVALCKSMGIEDTYIKEGIEDFVGIKRRREVMKKIGGCTVIADYAHHPDQIKQTICKIQSIYKKSLILFQPHTYSRTASLFNKFVNCLSMAKELVLFETYAAREKYDYKGSAKRLSENIKGCVFCSSVKDGGAIVCAMAQKYDCIAVIGAGDLYDYVEEYLQTLN